MKHFAMLLCVNVLFCLGCGPKLPENMPKLHPISLTVTQQNRPLADASVLLAPLDADNPWTSGGRTDNYGVLKARTHGRYRGVPAGKYKVCVRKIRIEGDPAPSEMELIENPNLSRGKPQKFFHTVPFKYDDPNETPFEIEVTDKSNRFSIDIPEEVKIPIVEPSPRACLKI